MEVTREMAAAAYEICGLIKWHNISTDIDWSGEAARDEIEDYVNKSDLDLTVNYGASKVVIVNNDADFVIKIPTYSTHYESESTDSWYSGCGSYEEFSGAFCPLSDTYTNDYCQREEELYTLAKERGVQQFFLQTKFLEEYCGRPVYIQPRATKIGFDYHRELPKPVKQYFTSVAKSPYNIPFKNSAFISEVYERYGLNAVINLEDFIREYEINDLHDDNIGRFFTTPVLLDYAGFCD